MSARRSVAAFFIALVLALCLGPAVPAQPPQPQPFAMDGVYEHQPSGMRFPPVVADFARVQAFRYDATGSDISVGYNFQSPSSTIVATVYVYPAPPLTSIGSPPEVIQSARIRLCTAEFERRKQEIAETYRDIRLMSEGDAARPQPGLAVIGKVADYEYPGRNGLPIRSDLYVYCYVGAKWAFEYRFTSQKFPDASAQISAFMKALQWTVPEKR